MQLQYAPDKDTRMGFVRCLLSLLQTLAALEDGGADPGSSLFAASQHASVYFSDTVAYVTSLSGIPDPVPCVVKLVDANGQTTVQPRAQDMDVDSASNGNGNSSSGSSGMSLEGEGSPSLEPDLKRSRGNEAEALAGTSQLAQFLMALTTKPRVVLLAENWRKADACLWLLRELIGTGWAVRDFLVKVLFAVALLLSFGSFLLHIYIYAHPIPFSTPSAHPPQKRELITELVDVFLGDSSPICGEQYNKGDRKRCPSSFVAVWALRNGSPSHGAKSVPDWTDLLEALTALLCSCRTPAMVHAEADIQADLKPFSSPPTLTNSPLAPPALDDAMTRCVSSIQLLNSMLRQSRYTPSTIRLVLHLSYENRTYSERACEAITDTLQQATVENTAHLFEVTERLLGLEDSLSDLRTTELLRNLGLLMRRWKDDPLKQRLLCVCIRSLLALVHTCPRVKALVRAQLDSWSWAVKFLYQMHASCEAPLLCLPSTPTAAATSSLSGGKESEARAADASSASSSSSSGYPTALATFTNPQAPQAAPFFPNTGSSNFYTVRSDEPPFRQGDVVVRDAAFLYNDGFKAPIRCTRVTDQVKGTATQGNLQSFDPMAVFSLLPTFLNNQGTRGGAADASTSTTSGGSATAMHPPANGQGSTVVPGSTLHAASSSTTSTSSAATRGIYLLVHGEDDSEREASWLSRCEYTRDILLALFTEMGADMDVLVAEALSAAMITQTDGSRSKPIQLGDDDMPDLVSNDTMFLDDDDALQAFVESTAGDT